MGGAIFLLENSPEKKHDFLSSLYSSSTIGGILLASFGVSLMSFYQIEKVGWRFLYLIGCITGLFGLIMRSRIDFKHVESIGTPLSKTCSDFLKAFWTYKKPLLLICFVAGFSYANYMIALVLMNGFIPLISSVTKQEMITLNTSLLVLDFLSLPFFGWLASKISREKIMLISALFVVVSGIPLFQLLENANFIGILIVRILFVLLGVCFYAPFHAWAQQLIPASHRYTLISFGYALGSQVFGGPTAALSLWVFKKTGICSSVSWYWVGLASLTTTFLFLTFRKKDE